MFIFLSFSKSKIIFLVDFGNNKEKIPGLGLPSPYRAPVNLDLHNKKRVDCSRCHTSIAKNMGSRRDALGGWLCERCK